MTKRIFVRVAGAVVALATLAGCSASEAPVDSEVESTPVTAEPTVSPEVEESDGPERNLQEGDVVSVPAVERWGKATVFKDVEPTGPVPRVTVDFDAVPVDVFEVIDSPDGQHDCVFLRAPDVDGMSFARVDAPNGAGAVFKEHGVHGEVARIACVAGGTGGEDTPLFAELDAVKEDVLADGTVQLRATLKQQEVVLDD